MAKRMLIDATHPEETRVVVLNGNRIEDFDVESSTKKQVKGNIYLAKITRVEPSLQAAFVEYGGNRHGFLAFSEIHPDYYRIPVGDRHDGGAELDPPAASEPEIPSFATPGAALEDRGVALEDTLPEPVTIVEPTPEDETVAGDSERSGQAAPERRREPVDFAEETPPPAEPTGDLTTAEAHWLEPAPAPVAAEQSPTGPNTADEAFDGEAGHEADTAPELPFDETGPAAHEISPAPATAWATAAMADDRIAALPERAEGATDGFSGIGEEFASGEAARPTDGGNGEAEAVETLGGDEFEEAETQRSRVLRHYKIQEVVKRRQIMLVQVTKEERGNKGAALTTYLSLAGRYCVLMPNTARGGGVSRKITSLADRRRLKDILEELDIPEGMGVIVRTAGAERSKAEIKRDYEYLLRLWNEIRDLTLQSTAPALIYEEGDLIKRSIRDLYARDIDEVLVEGEDGYRSAKAFMKMLMPSHAKRVQPYRDSQIGLLHRFQVESQIDAIHSPIVQLRSGGYVVIDQTEALVAIDVNSGRSTRERNIEETALRTNLEAAEEIARQLRLRDLAGLIVIDFIDMEEHRNQGAVERRLKDALKSDRARIQVGRISPFGLLEMSRQRLRPSLVEASTQPCPHCGGTGFIRSTESTALYVLRAIEEEGMRRRSAEACVYVPTTVALYILNHKRESLAQLESRYSIHVVMARDDTLIPPAFRLERLRALEEGETVAPAPAPLTQAPDLELDETEDEPEGEAALADGERNRRDDDDERGRLRRRRRRRRRHDDEPARAASADGPEDEVAAAERAALPPVKAAVTEDEAGDDEDEAGRLRRRRGRRGGRRRGRRDAAPATGVEFGRPAAETIEIVTSDSATTNEPLPAADAADLPTEPGDELVEPLAPVAIEAASLPALAGDPVPAEQPADAVWTELPPSEPPPPEPLPDASRTIEASPEPAPAESSLYQTPAEPSPDPDAGPPAATPEVVEPDHRSESDPRPATRVPGNGGAPPAVPADAGLAHAASDPQPADAAETAPAGPDTAGQIVQEVTRKPENPRRGWWQRLIQP